MEGKNKKTKVFRWAAALMLAAMMIVGCKQAQGSSSSGEENKKTETPVTPNTPAAAEKYAVTFGAGEHGTLKAKAEGIAETETSPITIEQGKTVTFRAMAESGYVVDKWTVTPADALQSGGTAGSDTAMVKVSAATTVKVTFKPDVGSFEDTGDGFIKISPPAAGITGKDPTYTLPGTEDRWKGVFRAGRKVKLSPYKLGKTEVPYKLWKEVYDWAIGNGYAFANVGKKGSSGSGSEEEPVTTVSWRDCIVWCNAYTHKTNNADTDCVYRKGGDHTVVLKDATKGSECDAAYADMSKKGFRLPTEAEWEYAARWQGSDNTNADKYGEVWLTKLNSASGAKKPIGFNGLTLPEGDTWESLRDEVTKVAVYDEWWDGNSWKDQVPETTKTAEVGKKIANALGLHDMSGNVWEWCFDWYGNIEAGDGTDPQGAASGSRRVMRGGSWGNNAESCVVGERRSDSPSKRGGVLGLRLALRP